jgi:transposase
MRYIFLPPYSPDLNPIELAFSLIKTNVRRDRRLHRMDLRGDDSDIRVYLIEAGYSVTAEQAAGFFHHCGYS